MSALRPLGRPPVVFLALLSILSPMCWNSSGDLFSRISRMEARDRSPYYNARPRPDDALLFGQNLRYEPLEHGAACSGVQSISGVFGVSPTHKGFLNRRAGAASSVISGLRKTLHLSLEQSTVNSVANLAISSMPAS